MERDLGNSRQFLDANYVLRCGEEVTMSGGEKVKLVSEKELEIGDLPGKVTAGCVVEVLPNLGKMAYFLIVNDSQVEVLEEKFNGDLYKRKKEHHLWLIIPKREQMEQLFGCGERV